MLKFNRKYLLPVNREVLVHFKNVENVDYVSDVFDIKKSSWFSCDLSRVSRTAETDYIYLFIFSSPVRSTGSELMSSPVRRRRPMLTFALRSNVDKLLGPG